MTNFSAADLFPHPQLPSGETRAAACHPVTTQARSVAFSVPVHPGEPRGTQDVQSHKPLSFTQRYFCHICCQRTVQFMQRLNVAYDARFSDLYFLLG